MARAVSAATALIDRTADRRQGVAWVVVEEIDGEHLSGESQEPGAETIAVAVHVFHLLAPTDEMERVDLAELFQNLCTEARPTGESRPITISIAVTDVTEGWWGQGTRGPSGHRMRSGRPGSCLHPAPCSRLERNVPCPLC